MDKRILFVDDDEFLVTCFKRLLGQHFNLETALGPEEAMAALTERGPYAVIVSDLRMPSMNGIELLTRAKEMAPTTVGMILTGNADFPDVEKAIRSGVVFKCLDKPCDMEELQVAITEALARHTENTQVA